MLVDAARLRSHDQLEGRYFRRSSRAGARPAKAIFSVRLMGSAGGFLLDQRLVAFGYDGTLAPVSSLIRATR